MDKLKKFLTYALLTFALISIGVAIGRHTAKTSVPTESNLTKSKSRQVIVYYLHATFRCVTCNTIEQMTKALLDSTYKNELALGKIKWIEDNFQVNETLAKKFEVVSSGVVVAEMQDDVITDFKRLDKVWTLMKDHKAFNNYIKTAIDGYLKEAGGQS